METLTKDQQLAVTSNRNLILVAASPGAGKTRVLIERIKRLIGDGVHPSDILAITFTTAAARVMLQRLDGITPRYVGTLHGYMLGLLQQHGDLIGFNQHAITVLDEEATDKFIEQQCQMMRYNGSKADIKAALAEGIPGPHTRTTPAALLAGRCYHQMRHQNMITFDAILVYGLLLIEAMKSRRNAGWPEHLFVDEFQDSGKFDARIYEALPIKNKFYVGDSDQAIFGFRGGNLNHLMRVAGKSEVIYLQDNFRSGPEICEVAQRLIEHNDNRLPKKLIARQPRAIVYFQEYATPEEEARGIAQTIKGAVLPGSAVLVRTNELVEWYSQALKFLGLKVAKREPIVLPADWGMAKLFVTFMTNPDNDYLAHQWLVMTRGKQYADDIGAKAALKYQSINEYSIKAHFVGVLNASAADELWIGIGEESQALMLKAIQTLERPTFASWLLAMMDLEHDDKEDGDGIVVSTIHSAKGREWLTVFCPAMEQHIIPGDRKDVDISEERRLAFVAFTRAKSSLHISWSKERVRKWQGQKALPSIPSQFISEAKGKSI